jgi:hypothetical protein
MPHPLGLALATPWRDSEWDTTMKTTVVLATSLALSAVALSASTAAAQGLGRSLADQRTREQVPCAVTRSLLDSARVDAISILFSEHPLVADLRREQGIPNSAAQVAVTPVSDGSLCKRLASEFDRSLSSSTRVAVLRVGPIFYARDPDQRRGTGIFADSTLHVVMRLGPAMDK